MKQRLEEAETAGLSVEQGKKPSRKLSTGGLLKMLTTTFCHTHSKIGKYTEKGLSWALTGMFVAKVVWLGV